MPDLSLDTNVLITSVFGETRTVLIVENFFQKYYGKSKETAFITPSVKEEITAQRAYFSFLFGYIMDRMDKGACNPTEALDQLKRETRQVILRQRYDRATNFVKFLQRKFDSGENLEIVSYNINNKLRGYTNEIFVRPSSEVISKLFHLKKGLFEIVRKEKLVVGKRDQDIFCELVLYHKDTNKLVDFVTYNEKDFNYSNQKWKTEFPFIRILNPKNKFKLYQF
ncbi:MAG: hypothetical protein ABH821_05010 [archaeon]